MKYDLEAMSFNLESYKKLRTCQWDYLDSVFSWQETPEGFKYWNDVYSNWINTKVLDYDAMAKVEAMCNQYEQEYFLKAEAVTNSPTFTVNSTEKTVTHYTKGEIECVDYLYDNMPLEAFVGGCEWAVKKYLHRWRYKEKPVKDLRKARDYLSVLIDVLEGKKPEFKEWSGV